MGLLCWTRPKLSLYAEDTELLRIFRIFYDTTTASAIFYAVVCQGGKWRHRGGQEKTPTVKRVSSAPLDCPLDYIEEVGERRVLSTLSSARARLRRPEAAPSAADCYTHSLKRERCAAAGPLSRKAVRRFNSSLQRHCCCLCRHITASQLLETAFTNYSGPYMFFFFVHTVMLQLYAITD